MNKKYYLLFILLFGTHFFSNAQLKVEKLEFSTALINNINYTQYSPLKPISEFGANYQRKMFEQTYVVFGLQGIGWGFNDCLKDSLNPIDGKIDYRQWMGSVGVRHLFKEEIMGEFNYFGEGSFHYNSLNTERVYTNGNNNDTLSHTYKRFNGVGFGFKFGTIYQSYDNWYVGANVTIYLSGGKQGEARYSDIKDLELKRPVETLVGNESLARFPIEFRVGFRL